MAALLREVGFDNGFWRLCGELRLAGDSLDFEDRIHIAVDSRGFQLLTLLARTLVICISWKRHMAALLANKPSIQMRRHGSELNPEDAVGTADD